MLSGTVRAARAGMVLGLALTILATGCTGLPTQMPDRPSRMPRAYVYYLDGAGGGTAVKNWAEGVKDGLLAAGYPGAGEMFSWETGRGLIVDQYASVKYKRSKAAEMAKRVQEYRQAHPIAPVSFIGFSAGTAVAVFALEALPETCQVDNVVLLGTSIGADYDLTQALKRVRNRLFIFTSTKDGMINVLMAFSGTTDRKYDEAAAGAKGFLLPAGATEETRNLYAEKVVTIPWRKEFERDGDHGRHFDNVKMAFIRDHVAPLVMGKASAGQGVPSPSTGR